MNFDFATLINPSLEKLDFSKALDTAETELQKIPSTVFHSILGKSLVNQAEDLASWVQGFYDIVTSQFQLKALYFEMNEFDINTDHWYIDGFAYDRDGGLDLKSRKGMEWLVDYNADTQRETGSIYIIQGYEDLQTAFGEVTPDTPDLENTRDWCEQIVIARFMELMRSAHSSAQKRDLKWAKLPIYFTEHSYDFIVRSAI